MISRKSDLTAAEQTVLFDKIAALTPRDCALILLAHPDVWWEWMDRVVGRRDLKIEAHARIREWLKQRARVG